MAWSWQAQCTDVATRGHLNVLTINLLFSEIENRQARLEIIADWIETQTFDAEEPIDVILLQEVVGGELSETTNSSLDLKQLLAERNMEYNLRYRLANGLPFVLSVGNAILSRCKITLTIDKILPFASEEIFDGFEIPLKRKVVMSRIKVPNFGKINVYNTHLCAFCDETERLEQTKVLKKFIEDVENFFSGENPVILGGDFNATFNSVVYGLITTEFIDTYAESNDYCTNCCSEIEGYEGCTFASPGDPLNTSDDNPYAINIITGDPEDPVRIDYIFGKGIEVNKSIVIFNPNPDWASDHCAVFTEFNLD